MSDGTEVYYTMKNRLTLKADKKLKKVEALNAETKYL